MAVNPNLTIRYAEVDLDYERVLAETSPEGDGPVWMVNFMKYRPVAEYVDGRATDLTGEQADDQDAPFEAFEEVGAELVFLAAVDTQLLGADPAWDRVAVVKYPNRRAFVDMTHLRSFEEKHPHKDAGMERTIVVGGVPRSTPSLPADAPGWEDVPHPPTDEDPAIVVFHLLRFAERAGAGASVSETANELGIALGTAVLGSIMIAVYRANLGSPTGIGPNDLADARETLGAAVSASERLGDPAGPALLEAARGAFVDGVRTASLVAVVALAVVAAWALRSRLADSPKDATAPSVPTAAQR